MNDQKQCTQMTDREQMTDLLTTQKQMTASYNTFLCESATPEVRSCLLSVLRDEHTVAEELFCTMNTRGWYPVTKAEDQKVTSTKDQYARFASV